LGQLEFIKKIKKQIIKMEENISRKQRRRLERMAEKEKFAKKRTSKKTVRSIIIWLLTLVIIAGAVWGIIKLAQKPASQGGGDVVATDQNIAEQDWTQGPEGAVVELIEYSDFQCPACAAYQPIVDQILEKYPNDVRFAYRQYPLVSIHQNAYEAAQASEAAGLQGKFWQMHSSLFENQRNWETAPRAKAIFKGYGEEIGLDMDKFDADFNSSVVKDAIAADIIAGESIPLLGTPTFLLNGRLIANPRTVGEFESIIEAEISKLTSEENAT